MEQGGQTFRQLLVTSFQVLVSSCQLLVISHQLLVTTSYQLSVISHYSLVTSHQLRKTSHQVLVTKYQLLVTNYQLILVTSSQLIQFLVRTTFVKDIQGNCERAQFYQQNCWTRTVLLKIYSFQTSRNHVKIIFVFQSP